MDTVSAKINAMNSFFNKVKHFYQFLFLKKIKVILIVLLCMSMGLIYSLIIPVKYLSQITFVVEETKSGLGGLSSIAGQFGIDLGGGSNNGVFSTDNISLFLRSEDLCREVLLTEYDKVQNLSLADKYLEASSLNKKWKKITGGNEVYFGIKNSSSLSRIQDSLLHIVISKRILINELSVFRPDKKSSFVMVQVSMPDERLSKLFCERLVSIATSRYVSSKIYLKSMNVSLLQKRADSLMLLLNQKTFSVASDQQKLVDANPAIRVNPAKVEIANRDKNIVGTVFAEVVKNLEISKTILSQETPAIQIVDQSRFPLEKIKPNKIKSLLIGAIVGFLSIFFYFAIHSFVSKKA